MCTGAEIQAGVAIGGMVTSYIGSQRKREAQKQMSEASQQAEALRREQMRFDYDRKTRELARDAVQKRAFAESQATAQTGSSALGGSSALPGAEGQIAQERGVKQTDLNTKLRIGESIFDANAAYARAQSRAATGGGIAAIGSAITGGAGPIGNIGSTILNSNYGNPNAGVSGPPDGSIMDTGESYSTFPIFGAQDAY